MAHDNDEQFLRETPTGINFEEEALKFFDPEAAADFLHPNQQPVEESIYTDDPVRCICAKWARYRCSRVKARSILRGAWSAASCACRERSAGRR